MRKPGCYEQEQPDLRPHRKSGGGGTAEPQSGSQEGPVRTLQIVGSGTPWQDQGQLSEGFRGETDMVLLNFTSVMQTVRMYLTGTKLVTEDQAGSNVMNEAANCG